MPSHTSYADALAVKPDWERFGGSDLTPLAQETLKEIKKHYSGRVGVGLGDASLHGDGLNIEGFDYFQFSYYPQPDDTTLTRYFDGLPEILSVSRDIANKNNISEVVYGEGGVVNAEGLIPVAFNWSTLVTDVNTEKEYYERFFEGAQGEVDGYILDYSGLFGIKDEPSEAVVREWFGKL